MIRNAKDMAVEFKERMRDGNGTVEIMHIYKQEELKGNNRLCAKVIIPHGGSIGMHQHVNEEEIYYILKGKGLVNDDGTLVEVNEGDSVLTRDGATHSIENIGEGNLEMIAVISLY